VSRSKTGPHGFESDRPTRWMLRLLDRRLRYSRAARAPERGFPVFPGPPASPPARDDDPPLEASTRFEAAIFLDDGSGPATTSRKCLVVRAPPQRPATVSSAYSRGQSSGHGPRGPGQGAGWDARIPSSSTRERFASAPSSSGPRFGTGQGRLALGAGPGNDGHLQVEISGGRPVDGRRP